MFTCWARVWNINQWILFFLILSFSSSSFPHLSWVIIHGLRKADKAKDGAILSLGVRSLWVPKASSQKLMKTIWLLERFERIQKSQNSKLPVLPSTPLPLEIRTEAGPVQQVIITVYENGASSTVQNTMYMTPHSGLSTRLFSYFHSLSLARRLLFFLPHYSCRTAAEPQTSYAHSRWKKEGKAKALRDDCYSGKDVLWSTLILVARTVQVLCLQGRLGNSLGFQVLD